MMLSELWISQHLNKLIMWILSKWSKFQASCRCGTSGFSPWYLFRIENAIMVWPWCQRPHNHSQLETICCLYITFFVECYKSNINWKINHIDIVLSWARHYHPKTKLRPTKGVTRRNSTTKYLSCVFCIYIHF